MTNDIIQMGENSPCDAVNLPGYILRSSIAGSSEASVYTFLRKFRGDFYAG